MTSLQSLVESMQREADVLEKNGARTATPESGRANRTRSPSDTEWGHRCNQLKELAQRRGNPAALAPTMRDDLLSFLAMVTHHTTHAVHASPVAEGARARIVIAMTTDRMTPALVRDVETLRTFLHTVTAR